jgi:hypothetical protein
MSHYGIVATHWNASLGEIDEVQLHKVVRRGQARFGLSPGEPTWCSDVAHLIDAGHTVWVVVTDRHGKYTNTERVGVDTDEGGRRRLYSRAKDGTTTSALADLPRYIRPDDPLPDSARALLARAKQSAPDWFPTLTHRMDEEPARGGRAEEED